MDECQRSNATQLSPPSGYLALRRHTAEEIRTPTCCWTIRGRIGQRVEVTLLRLGASDTREERRDSSRSCPRHVTIKEKGGEKRINLCKYGTRENTIHKSTSNVIQICADDRKEEDPAVAWMLFYEGECCIRHQFLPSIIIIINTLTEAVVGMHKRMF